MTTADETHDFTEREFEVIFAVCSRRLPSKEIAQQLGIAQDTVMHAMTSIFDKAGISTRLELFEFVKTALNSELRRLKARSRSACVTSLLAGSSVMDRPRMSREKIATLVVGQEVRIGYGSYGCKGKVVKITEDTVGVQCSGSNLTIWWFDKDGKETSDSRRQRIISAPVEEEFFTGDWHLFPETEPWCIEYSEAGA